MKKTIKKSPMTENERNEILQAASFTWQTIASDVSELCEGRVTFADAHEFVADADRILTLGRLNKDLYSKYRDELYDFLKKNRSWY